MTPPNRSRSTSWPASPTWSGWAISPEPGTSTPKDLTGYTGTFDLSTIGPNPVLTLDGKTLTVKDAVNGVVSLSLQTTDTDSLVSRRGFAEDGYPIVPTYKAELNLTDGSEPISVEIPKVYISDMGA